VLVADVGSHVFQELACPLACAPRGGGVARWVGRFDLIHSHFLLAFFEDPAATLAALVQALRPGGWLLLEHQGDQPPTIEPGSPCGEEFNRFSTRVYEACARYGVDFTIGPRLPRMMAALGLTDIDGETTTRVNQGGPLPTWFSMLVDSWRNGLVAGGLLTEADIDEGLAALARPSSLVRDAPYISVLARKPDA
jgi:SAM-dependent methyltransferase